LVVIGGKQNRYPSIQRLNDLPVIDSVIQLSL